MDKIQITDIQRAAQIHWRMLHGKAVPADEYRFCVSLVLGDYAGGPGQHLLRNLAPKVTDSIFQRHPAADRLIREWKHAFAEIPCIGHADAAQFLVAVHSSLEDVERLLANRITPGVTRHRRATLSDYITLRPRTKSGWTLMLTTLGGGRHNCVRSVLVTQPGDLVLYSPDALYDYGRAADCELWEHRWVYFPQEPRWLDLLRWPEIGPGIHHVHAPDAAFAKLHSLFEEMVAVHGEHGAHASELVRNLLEEVLLRTRRLVPDEVAGPMDARIQRATDYIARHFHESISVEAVADRVGLSPARLALLFKQQTGVTIKQWRDERRMARAAQLLLHTRLPVSRIAERVGYDDPLYFSRCFNKHFACSPRAYRERAVPDLQVHPDNDFNVRVAT